MSLSLYIYHTYIYMIYISYISQRHDRHDNHSWLKMSTVDVSLELAMAN